MTAASIRDRMDVALDRLERHSRGRRRPKAFYLSADDWVAFEATSPPRARFAFGNNPPVYREEPQFRGLPIRRTRSATAPSRLYDHTSTGRAIP